MVNGKASLSYFTFNNRMLPHVTSGFLAKGEMVADFAEIKAKPSKESTTCNGTVALIVVR